MLEKLLTLLRPLWQWAKRHPVLSSITVLVLIRLAISFLMLSRYLADYGYIVLSADDTTRGALAYTFWHSPFLFPPSHFLPLHSYIAGLVIGMVGDIHDSCVAVSLTFGIITLVMGYLVGRRLAGELGGWVAALLLLLEPYPFWVSFSGGLTDTIFYALILAGLLVILYLRERPGLIWLGSVVFLLATMTRYEAVSYIVVFAGVVIWLVVKGKTKWWVALPALLIVTLYQGGVLVWNYVEMGNPMSVVENYAAGMYADSRTILADSAIAHLTFPFKVLWQNNPLLVWFLPLAVVWAFWGKKPSALAAGYCVLGFAFLFYIVQDKGAGFAPNRYFAQVYVTALPVLAAMLVASYKWLRARVQVLSVASMLPFVLVFAQLATSWTKVQTLTIGFNHHGVGMPPITRETGKLLESMWAAGLLAEDEKVLIEMKPHEMYGIPYFSNHPDRFQVYEQNRNDERSDPILATLDYLLVMKDNNTAILLSPELINRYMDDPGKYKHLVYPFLYGEAPVQVLMIYPPYFPLYTCFSAISPYGEAAGDFYKEGMVLPLEAIWNQYPAGAVLHGDLSFVAKSDAGQVNLEKKPMSLLIAAPYKSLEYEGATGWFCDGKLVEPGFSERGIKLEGNSKMVLECWIPVTSSDFNLRIMELNIDTVKANGKVRVNLISELGKEYPFPGYNTRYEQILTNESSLAPNPNAPAGMKIVTGFTLMPGNHTLRFNTNDIMKLTDETFDLGKMDFLHIKLEIETLEDNSLLDFKLLWWKYSFTGNSG